MLSKLGIIAGGGVLPVEVAHTHIKRGGQCYIAVLEEEVHPDLLESNFECQSFPLGSVGGVIRYFKQHGVKNIVLAGKISRPNFKSIKGLDFAGSQLMAKIVKERFLGDDKILRAVMEFFEENGFTILAPDSILSAATSHAPSLLITSTAPSAQDEIDAEFGFTVIKSLGNMDVGQAVIVQNGYVLGIEAAEGTDNLIIRCAALRREPTGGTLVKALKNSQDVRIDLPTIGLQTIHHLINFSYNGIAIQQDRVIIVEEKNAISLANQYNIFIKKYVLK